MKFLIPLIFLTIGQLASQSALQFQDLFNAEDDESIACYRIPALITASNGDLLATIDERVPSCADLRGSKDINIVLRRSTDNGKSWSEIERIVDFEEGLSASDPSFILDQITGDIFLFYNYMDLDNEPNIYYLHYVKSKDNGKTWGEPEDITEQISMKEWRVDFKFITSGRGTQTEDGKLLHTLVNLDHGTHIFGSEDHGKTWKLYANAILPANESKIITLSDKSWMVNSRVNKSGVRYSHISTDEGETWNSKAESTLVDPSCNASIIRYDKNTLLFLNANSSSERKNLTIRKSMDDGKTWSAGSVLYPGGSAYSTMTLLNDGSIGFLFEKDDYKANAFAKIKIDDVK